MSYGHDPNADSNTYSHGYGCTDSDGYRYRHRHSHSDTGAYTNPDSNGYRHGDTSPKLRSNTRGNGQLVATGRQRYRYLRPEQRDAAGRSCLCARESRAGHERQWGKRRLRPNQFIP